MYRVIFEQHPKSGQEAEYIAQWKRGSDIIQTYPGALGTKLFRKIGDEKVLYAMAEWESKGARDVAMEEINKRSDADMVLHGHKAYLENTLHLGEFELIAESNPT